jgi:hypothetical protein
MRPADRPDTGQISARLWWTVLAAVAALLLFPLLLIDVPPLLDYPNHLARLYVLAFPDDAVLSRIYAQHWSIIPNLAVDLLVPPLLHVLPVYLTGRIVLAIALLLPVLGCAAYSRAAFGRRSLWPLGSALIAYNALFILGFLNFQIATGLALMLAAGWCAWSDRNPLAVGLLGGLGATALFFCHIFGVLLFGVLVGAREAALIWQHWGWRRAVGRAALLCAVLLVPVALYVAAPLRDAAGPSIHLPPARKLLRLMAPFADYDVRLTLLTTGGTIAVVYFLARTRSLAAAPGTALATAVLLLAYTVLPDIARHAAFIDARIPILLGLLLFAGIAPTPLPRRGALVTAVVFGALLLLRIASVADAWTRHAADLANLRAVIAQVPPGAKVLVATVDGRNGSLPARKDRTLPGYMTLESHMAALLVIERRAFWPLLFTDPAQQPLAVLPPFVRLALPQGKLPDFHELTGVPTEAELIYAPYLANWRCDFDYVLLLEADAAGDPGAIAPDRLELLHTAGMAALFRVRPPQSC